MRWGPKGFRLCKYVPLPVTLSPSPPPVPLSPSKMRPKALKCALTGTPTLVSGQTPIFQTPIFFCSRPTSRFGANSNRLRTLDQHAQDCSESNNSAQGSRGELATGRLAGHVLLFGKSFFCVGPMKYQHFCILSWIRAPILSQCTLLV